TSIPGLVLLPPLYEPPGALLSSGKRPRWIGRIHELPADYVMLDLGAGIARTSLDLFAAADVGVVVTTPEPPSIEATYRFLRAVFVRGLAHALSRNKERLALVMRALDDLPPLPSPLALVEAIGRHDGAAAALAKARLAQLRPRLVVSKTRLRTDIDLGT